MLKRGVNGSSKILVTEELGGIKECGKIPLTRIFKLSLTMLLIFSFY